MKLREYEVRYKHGSFDMLTMNVKCYEIIVQGNFLIFCGRENDCNFPGIIISNQDLLSCKVITLKKDDK